MCLLARDSPAAIPDRLLVSYNTMVYSPLPSPANTRDTNFLSTGLLSTARGDESSQVSFREA